MAAFADDLAAVAASLEMLRAFDKFRADVPNGARTHLKLGVYPRAELSSSRPTASSTTSGRR